MFAFVCFDFVVFPFRIRSVIHMSSFFFFSFEYSIDPIAFIGGKNVTTPLQSYLIK